ncbi:ABC transporter permease [Chryseobacterium sp. Leaf180]|uniref:hypothetical protein n=1 Tax=Chryseobacterium sp. Leaf180 TaxID=1736289 RepID=UPI0006FED6AD|nr:hypothetical protein [Chryseobacterium sp. Leaf180]KQR95657.1 ABC transporter permease [Chryseobacterium sp. Leaf180]
MTTQISSRFDFLYRFISNFFNPMISLFIYFIYMSVEKYSLKEASVHFLPILILTIIPVMGWIIYRVRTGRYTNMDVSNRLQRKSLYYFAESCMVVYLIYFYWQTNLIDLVMLFILILLLVLHFSNLYIKSSMHTAYNVFVAALFYGMNWKIGVIWFLIAALVGFTRIKLKRHTLPEVLLGAGISIFVSFIYLYFSPA